MEIRDKNTIKSKSFAISAIMKNKKLASAIFDSMDSPIGSTKRQKAKSILKSLSMPTQNRYDGMGGPGIDWSKLGVNTLQNKPATPSWQTSSTPMPSGPMSTPNGPSIPEGPMSMPLTPGGPMSTPNGPMSEIPNLPTRIVPTVDALMAKKMEKLQGPMSTESKAYTFGRDILRPAGSRMARDIYNAGKLTLRPFFGSAEAMKDKVIDFGKAGESMLRGITNVVGGTFGAKPIQKPSYARDTYSSLPPKKATLSSPDAKFKTVVDANSPESKVLFERGWTLRSDGEKSINLDEAKNKYQSLTDLVKSTTYVKPEVTMVSPDGETKDVILNSDDQKKLTDIGWSMDITGMAKANDPANYTGTPVGQLQKESADRTALYESTLGLLGGSQTSPQGYKAGDDVDYTGAANYDGNDFNNMEDNFGEGSVNSYLEGLDPSLREYYEKSFGPESFSNAILDLPRSEMAKVLGMTEETLATLPIGGSLGEQLVALKDKIWKENDLNKQLDELTDLKNRGYSFTDNLQSYVRGQDEYLGDINEMQFKAREMTANMDTSNPYVAQKMQNWANYLTILEGRQNQRYTDFLNESIDDYNDEYKIASDQYTEDYNRAIEEYNSQATITTNSYNQFKAVIGELYNNIASRGQMARDSYEWGLDMEKKQADTAKSVLEAAKLQNEMKYGSNDWSNPKYDDLKEILYGTDETGEIDYTKFDTYNPLELMNLASSQNQNPDVAKTFFIQQHGAALENGATNGNFKDEASNLGETHRWLEEESIRIGNMSPEEQAASYGADYASTLTSLAGEMEDMLKYYLANGFKKYLSNTESGIIDNIRSAVEKLEKKSSMSMGDFASKYQEDFQQLTPEIYNWAKANMSDGVSAAEMLPENQSNEYLSSIIASELVEIYLYQNQW